MKHSFTQSAVARIVTSIENESCAQMHAELQERVLPETKTISEYVCALDRAAREFFLYGSDDDILAVLKDARKHQSCPSAYKLVDDERFETNGLSVRKAIFSYDTSGKVTIKLYFSYGNVKISDNKVVVIGGITITPELGKLIGACQHTILRMQNVLKKKK